MTEGTQPQEIKEVPQETKEVAEARQELDKATLEPESAMEKVAPEYQQAEEVEAALKEAVQAASAQTAAADGGRETEDRAVEINTQDESLGETPPNPESPDPVAPMFPASAQGAGVSESSIDVAKIPADGTSDDDFESSPVQDVGGAAVPASAEDFSAEMENAQSGEVRGFAPEEGGSQTYEFKTDGHTGTQTVEERVETIQAVRETPPEGVEAEILPELSPKGQEFTGSLSTDQQEPLAGVAGGTSQDHTGIMEQSAEPAADGESSADEDLSAGTAKALGGGEAPAASGLAVDDGGERDNHLEGDQTNSTIPFTELVDQWRTDVVDAHAFKGPVEVAPESLGDNAHLELQQNMQQENRQYTLISNIIKIKHNEGKATIHNVRGLEEEEDGAEGDTTQIESVLPGTSQESSAGGLTLASMGGGSITIDQSEVTELVDQAALRDQLLGSTSGDTDSSDGADSSGRQQTTSGRSYNNIPVSGFNQAANVVTDGPTIPGGSVLSAAQNGMAGLKNALGEGTAGSETPPDDESTPESSYTSDQPQPEDFLIGIDENGDPIFDQEAYNVALEEWNAAQAAETTESGSDTPDEIQERIDELYQNKTEINNLIQEINNYLAILQTAIENNTWVGSPGGEFSGNEGITQYPVLEQEPDGSFTLGSAGGQMTLEEQEQIPGIIQQDLQILYNAIAEIDTEIKKLMASLEE